MTKNKKVYEDKIPYNPFTDEPMYYPSRIDGYVNKNTVVR